VSEPTLHPLAEDYLKRLKHAGRGLPRGRMRELTLELEEHLAEAIPPGASDAEALTVLDRLGEPEEIIAAEWPAGDPAADGRGIHEWAAIFLLLLGGFVFGIGWIVGVILLWSSRAWNSRDKLLATLIIPGGLATGLLIFLAAGVAVSTTPGGASVVCTIVAGPRPANPAQHCTRIVHASAHVGGANILAIVALVLVLIAPIAMSVYLAKRADRPRERALWAVS
jgi:hypothetical protein